MQGLFELLAPRPLADRLRPTRLDEVVGQAHLLGAGGAIQRMLASGRLASMILWGPPGSGKTTIARLLAENTQLHFEPLSAVFSGVAELRKIFEAARKRRADGRGTLLFIDEIHRFNRAQQDSFLPYVEDGTVILVGATTENPSFEVNAPLLSRAQVLIVNRLDDEALEALLDRAERHLQRPLPLDGEARAALRTLADGDGRYLFNMVETIAALPSEPVLTEAALLEVVQRHAPQYDKDRDGHYNLISALHKALRSADTDAALYWFARMIVGGEDPRYIARRLVRFAVEDVGLASPQALPQAIAAWEAYERLGSPEGELALVQCVVFLATAPKSNALYRAEGAAKALARQTGSLSPPKHILNAPTKLMRELGYGHGYEYDHHHPDAFAGQDCFPEQLPRQRLYTPSDRGYEREVGERLATWNRLRQERHGR